MQGRRRTTLRPAWRPLSRGGGLHGLRATLLLANDLAIGARVREWVSIIMCMGLCTYPHANTRMFERACVSMRISTHVHLCTHMCACVPYAGIAIYLTRYAALDASARVWRGMRMRMPMRTGMRHAATLCMCNV